MTETSALGTVVGGLSYRQRPSSSGRRSPVIQLRIVDERGEEVAVGERGDLLVRGVSVIKEYWNRPEETAAAFVDGWFKTGDVAYVDQDGFYYIVDRKKDLINRGGEKVGCGSVESCLNEHPAVLEASVYGLPDPVLGEVVGCTLQCKERVTEDQITSFLVSQRKLAKFEIPQFFHFTSEPLIRTASGKILKREIRENHLKLLAAKL